MSFLIGFLYIIFVSIVTVIGDILLKIAGNSDQRTSIKYFIYGMLLYLITGVGWFFALKFFKLSSIGVIYGITTVIFLVIIGVLFFQEKLNIMETIAVVMGIISILLLMRFG
ncbi:MAG: hypothetical protein A3C58_00650 [Candidatus Staskawiczbacteria bacterium RIFCSPHIGHO2_02_FULL_34_10]|uniref:EamA domain-containing protein n=1 Tax=Candidatus Staskawiczbacteria bacterium RIFCSPHIGHO2_02_FULL_34_10 TaxID=1802205 RepID=A0A1G2HV69_9BACT|nr:MAG: hypothetical protein A3C58_00650 [Candidatus Staskawiczbacteria bacterium RIFCSPHIGHO2_02_FULL_34_10]